VLFKKSVAFKKSSTFFEPEFGVPSKSFYKNFWMADGVGAVKEDKL